MSVVGCDVLHIAEVFQASLYLERGDAGSYHVFKLLAGVEIAERQQVLLLEEQSAVAIVEVVGGAAGLRAASAVAAAAVEVLTHVALTAVAHTEGAVDEGLEVETGGLSDLLHLLQGGFAGQHHAAKTHLFQELYAFHGGVVALGAGMQLDGWQVALQQPQVLDEQGVDTDIVELVYQLYGGFDFVVEEQRVDGHKDLGTIEMGVVHQCLDILECVGGGGAGAVGGRADIEGVGTVVDGFAAEVQVLRGGEQFQFHAINNVSARYLLHE